AARSDDTVPAPGDPGRWPAPVGGGADGHHRGRHHDRDSHEQCSHREYLLHLSRTQASWEERAIFRTERTRPPSSSSATVPRSSEGVTARRQPNVTLYEPTGTWASCTSVPSGRCTRTVPSSPLATNASPSTNAMCCGGAPASRTATGVRPSASYTASRLCDPEVTQTWRPSGAKT